MKKWWCPEKSAITPALLPRLQACWPSRLKVLAVNSVICSLNFVQNSLAQSISEGRELPCNRPGYLRESSPSSGRASSHKITPNISGQPDNTTFTLQMAIKPGLRAYIMCNCNFVNQRYNTHSFNDLFSRTFQVSWHQKGKPFWIWF